MDVISLFSGIGGFDLGLESAGMNVVAQVEVDPLCQSILHRHWPNIPLWEDICEVSGTDLPFADVVAFGSPCQDLSVAGTRQGLQGEKSRLFVEAIRIIKELRDCEQLPTWVIWENVRGSLWSSQGDDFAQVIDSLAECGAVDICWRVLDSQFFGVPQRRRRVFCVACFDPSVSSGREIFPVFEGVPRNSRPSRTQRKTVAGLVASSFGDGGADVDQAQSGQILPLPYVTSSWSKTLGNTQVDSGALIFDTTQITNPHNRSNPQPNGISHSLIHDGKPPTLAGTMGVRRLTPLECERLQGYPDDWTRWKCDNTEIADKPRYRMIGNGVVAPVAKWVGEQLVAISN